MKPLKLPNSIIILLICAAAIRIATVTCGTNVDEGVYWAEGREIADGYVMYRDVQLNKTPLVSLVAASFFAVGQTPIYPMRAVMLAFSILSLYIAWRLGKDLLDDPAATAAALILALEPFSCVWAKYLHTSSWAPWFETAVYWLLISGVRRKNSRCIFASGVVLGIYALSKQTAIFVIPPAVAAWLLFAEEKSWRRFFLDGAWWSAGILSIAAPFLIYVAAVGALPAMWFDIWTAHHLMAGAFAYHTMQFRWQECKSIFILAPLLWIAPFGSPLLWKSNRRRSIVFLWIWLATAFLGNIIIPTHLWKHYLLVCMPPAALLAGAFGAWLTRKITEKMPHPAAVQWGGAIVLVLFMLMSWPKNDWTYPGLSMTRERNLAAHISRYCREPFMLNLTNPAFYVWMDKKVPPVFQGERMTRMPYFMTIAGRGYCTKEDIQRTADYWKTIPIGCVIAYDKFLRQIEDDPLMEPLRLWLNDYYKTPQRVSMSDSYYGWFFIFEKKEK